MRFSQNFGVTLNKFLFSVKKILRRTWANGRWTLVTSNHHMPVHQKSLKRPDIGLWMPENCEIRANGGSARMMILISKLQVFKVSDRHLAVGTQQKL